MRWYSEEFPNVGECVMVRCTSVIDIGNYCELLEYGGLEGLVPVSEVTKQRVRHPSHIIPVGRVFVACVISIDQEKRYIDLSKKRVTEQDIEQCEERYFRSKKLYSILHQLSSQLGTRYPELSLESLYTIVWEEGQYNIEQILHKLESKYDQEEMVQLLISRIKEKYLSPKTVEIQAEVEITCFSIYGIEGIKESIRKGLAISPDIRIRILSAPTYLIQCVTKNIEEGIRIIQRVIEEIGRSLRLVGGELVITKEPRLSDHSAREELKHRMSVLERQQEQIEADDNS